MAWRGPVAWGCILSAGLHALVGHQLVGGSPAQVDQALTDPADRPSILFTAEAAPVAPVPDRAPTPGMPERPSPLDTTAAPGESGAGRRDDASIIMFSFVSEITLQDADRNNPRVLQTQRIRTADDRLTQEVRRATPNPLSGHFLASGRTGARERRALSPRSPAPGATRGESLAESHAKPSPEVNARGPGPVRPPAPPKSAQKAAGIVRGRGRRHTPSAPVRFERPAIDRGPAATIADPNRRHIRDTNNTEQLASQLLRSMIDASQLGSPSVTAPSPGIGGEKRQGLDASGNAAGGRATPFMPGAGRDGVLDSRLHGYDGWVHEQRKRVQKALVFPHALALAMQQGTSLLRVTISREGRLRGAPEVIRSSGFTEFDNAALAAVDRARPFLPPPDDMAPEARELSLLIPVAFENPMVR